MRMNNSKPFKFVVQRTFDGLCLYYLQLATLTEYISFIFENAYVDIFLAQLSEILLQSLNYLQICRLSLFTIMRHYLKTSIIRFIYEKLKLGTMIFFTYMAYKWYVLVVCSLIYCLSFLYISTIKVWHKQDEYAVPY